MLNALGEMQRILVLGGKSDLALSILEQLPLAKDSEVILCGRDLDNFTYPEYLTCFNIQKEEIDFTDIDRSKESLQRIFSYGDIDLAVFAYATLGDEKNQLNSLLFEKVLATNFFSQSVLLNEIYLKLIEQMHGQILIISSVAGMRPRRRNFVYGVSKFGVDFIAQGLQKEAFDKNVFITILRPGFVHTKMTIGMPRAPFATDRTSVARIASNGLLSKKRIVYAPRILVVVMWILKLLPERIFRIIDK